MPSRPRSEVDYARFKKDYRYPREIPTLRQELADAGIDLDALKDPWGTRYAIEPVIDENREGFNFTSAGPDKEAGTDDDIHARTITWKYFQQTHDRITVLYQPAPHTTRLHFDKLSSYYCGYALHSRAAAVFQSRTALNSSVAAGKLCLIIETRTG